MEDIKMKRFSEVKPKDFLKTPKQRAIYINAAIEDGDQKNAQNCA
jgi:DNA-binding phage protein